MSLGIVNIQLFTSLYYFDGFSFDTQSIFQKIIWRY